MNKIREYNPRVGETWVTRGGDKFVIIDVNTLGEHPIVAIDNKKRMAKFTRDGFFIGKAFPSPNDLIESV
jgi:hypothetical protein